MFYRPGGTSKRINAQQDTVYTDTIGGATGWMPVAKGYTVAVNVVKATLDFRTPADSTIKPVPVNPEVQVLFEMKLQNGDPDAAAFPIDQWQNMVVATSRAMFRDGFVRLRVLNINNDGGASGVAMALQVNRSGDNGAVH